MSSEVLRGASLVAALISTGFVGAIFVHWSNTVMPALRGQDDRSFVLGFRALNAAILNPLFTGFGFTGAAVFMLTAAALHLGTADRTPLPWILVAFALYLVAVVITIGIHLPMNAIIEAADPSRLSDASVVRERFQEARWVGWNHVRAVACVLSVGCLMWAVLLHGRS